MPPLRSCTTRSVIAAVVTTLLIAGAPVQASPSPGDGPEPPALHPVEVPAKPGASTEPFARAPVTRLVPDPARGRVAISGTLDGKTIYLSAGHGWNHIAGAWQTQRGNTHDLVEDFITVEGVNQYLLSYLQAMGAYVVPIREADLNAEMVVVDDGAAVIEGTVTERAPQVGWGPLPVPFTGTQNPFALGTARSMVSATQETGRVAYATPVTTSGYYQVYVSYVQGADRVADAHVIVRHAGGESHVRLDQRRHGSTWVLLGRWYFEAGAGVDRASIVVTNESATPGRVISFDAVRLGGGMAPHQRQGATTMRPAYESAARFSTQLLGAPAAVWDYTTDGAANDVVARPRFAAWEHEAGEDAIYLALHTNAPSPSRGTMSIAYGNTYPCCAGLSDFAGTPGSLELLHAVHDELVADIRTGWDPTWRNAGKVTASLGELRPSHNGEMPAILVELAFHATLEDAEALREPRFRRLSARAIAQGIARYFATKDGRALVLPPEPPTAVRVENAGGGVLRVSWRPPAADATGGDAPTTYRVHLSDNGYGFDDGVVVHGESFELTNLPPGALRFVRVTALNAGGASLPSEVVGARVVADWRRPLLIVGGVDRLDKRQMVRDAAPTLGTLDRMWLDRMNHQAYAARHATALAAAGFAFDGASDEAVEHGDLDLARYHGIDWFVGEDTGADDPLSAAARAELERFFLAGGNLLLSGSQLVSTLGDQRAIEARRFSLGFLHTKLASADAATYDVVPTDDLFALVGPISFFDDGPLGYDAEAADVLAPTATAREVLTYATGGAAAVAWDEGVGGSRGVVVGFPIEAIADDRTRRDLLAAAFGSFERLPEVVLPELAEVDGCGCATTDRGGATGGLAAAAAALVARRRRRR